MNIACKRVNSDIDYNNQDRRLRRFSYEKELGYLRKSCIELPGIYSLRWRPFSRGPAVEVL